MVVVWGPRSGAECVEEKDISGKIVSTQLRPVTYRAACDLTLMASYAWSLFLRLRRPPAGWPLHWLQNFCVRRQRRPVPRMFATPPERLEWLYPAVRGHSRI